MTQIEDALERMSSNLQTQRTRLGALQQSLDENARQLDRLASRIDDNLARLDALLTSRR